MSDPILEMVRKNVLQGEHHVRRQKEIIAEAQVAGYPTDGSETLLAVFEQSLALHRDHLKRLTSRKP